MLKKYFLDRQWWDSIPGRPGKSNPRLQLRGGAEMAGANNKFSFVRPGHIFGWNLMKLGMGPLFDMLYREKWSNSVRRTVRPENRQFVRRFFFHVFSRFGSFGVDLEKFFSTKIFDQKKLRKISRFIAMT